MLKNKAWINQYVFKVATKPDYLLNWEDDGFSPELLESFQERLSSFKRIYLELGSGSGAHLIERAAQDPESLYLGVELRYKRAFRTVEKAEKREIHNLAVVRSDAKLITKVVQPGSLAGVYINFPDPWNKPRWHKHRMLSPEFLPVLHRLLQADGFLAYKTDHQGAFEDAVQDIEKSGLFTTTAREHDLYGSPLLERSVPTEFEMLFRSKGLPIFFWSGQRIEAENSSPVAS